MKNTNVNLNFYFLLQIIYYSDLPLRYLITNLQYNLIILSIFSGFTFFGTKPSTKKR